MVLNPSMLVKGGIYNKELKVWVARYAIEKAIVKLLENSAWNNLLTPRVGHNTQEGDRKETKKKQLALEDSTVSLLCTYGETWVAIASGGYAWHQSNIFH